MNREKMADKQFQDIQSKMERADWVKTQIIVNPIMQENIEKILANGWKVVRLKLKGKEVILGDLIIWDCLYSKDSESFKAEMLEEEITAEEFSAIMLLKNESLL